MLMTVTNLTTGQLNYPDYYYGYPGSPPVLNAIGGNLVNPVPFPFNWVLFQPNGHGLESWCSGKRRTLFSSLFTRRTLAEFTPTSARCPCKRSGNALVQAGTVSIAYAAETGVRDFGDLFLTSVV